MLAETAEPTVATGKPGPDVRIEPWPGDGAYPVRGRKKIMVDGVQWGTIHMESHGSGGVSYWFEQKGYQGAIQDPAKMAKHLRNSAIEVRVNNSRRARWGDDAPVMPTETRLLDQVNALIASNQLRHPEVVEREVAERKMRYQERCTAEEAEQRASDLAAAHALIEAHAPGLNDRDPLANAIADALAKTRDRV